MTKVSVLVAVYNGEKYLEKCLDSLFSQTYQNLEIVCINDGSTDSTAEILRRQMCRDARIKLVEHHPNRGVAYAMNEGLKACTGDIISYLDADDWLDNDSIERLVDVFDSHDDADCVLMRCIFVYPDGRHEDYHGMAFDRLDGKTAFIESLTWNVHGIYAARAHLYKKAAFDTTCRHFSVDNTTRIHYYMSRAVYSSEAKYYYLQNPESITYQISIRRMDYMRAMMSMKRQLSELKSTDEVMAKYENERWKIVVDSYLFYYKHRRHLSWSERRYCLGEIRNGLMSIETGMLRRQLRCKFGFCPVNKSWWLFRLEEEIYFTLRRMAGRL